jgi:hypothetical protein
VASPLFCYTVFRISIYAAHNSLLDIVMVFVRGLIRNDFKDSILVFLFKSV